MVVRDRNEETWGRAQEAAVLAEVITLAGFGKWFWDCWSRGDSMLRAIEYVLGAAGWGSTLVVMGLTGHLIGQHWRRSRALMLFSVSTAALMYLQGRNIRLSGTTLEVSYKCIVIMWLSIMGHFAESWHAGHGIMGCLRSTLGEPER